MIKVITMPVDNAEFAHHCSCGAVFTYHHNDTKGDYIICPVCAKAEHVIGDKVYIPDDDELEEENESHFHYPDDFYHFGGDKAKKLTDDEIQVMINNVFTSLSRGKPGDFKAESTGDTMVSGWREEEQIIIWVAKDYWEDSCYTDTLIRE